MRKHRFARPSPTPSGASAARAIETAVVSMYSAHPSPSHRDKLEFASRQMALRLWCCGIDADDYIGRQVLDAGCGTGEYACWFAAHGARVTGIDLSDGSLSEARAYAGREGLPNVSLSSVRSSTQGFLPARTTLSTAQEYFTTSKTATAGSVSSREFCAREARF